MDNMEIKLVGKVLTITVPDVTIRELRDGKKTSRITTSHGWYAIDGTGIAVNCNVSYNPKYDTTAKETGVLSALEYAKLTPTQQKAYLKAHAG